MKFKDIKKFVENNCGEPLYSVEVSSDKAEFPFYLFHKQSYDDSKNYERDVGSWANYGFDTLEDAKEFANIARKLKLEARIFKLDVQIHFDYNILRGE